jgi:ABC-type amino acid transport substrate-binding protein
MNLLVLVVFVGVVVVVVTEHKITVNLLQRNPHPKTAAQRNTQNPPQPRKPIQQTMPRSVSLVTVPSRMFPLVILFLAFLFVTPGSSFQQQQQKHQQQRQLSTTPPPPPPPQLNGATFRVTVVEERGFVDVLERTIATTPTSDDGSDEDTTTTSSGGQQYQRQRKEFSGYLIQVMKAMADPLRANMTLEFVTPSGMTSLCQTPGCGAPPENYGIDQFYQQPPYAMECHGNYGCGTSDVTDVPTTNYTTDMYLSLFYITPGRQLQNQFSIPFYPPQTGTLTMVGTATRIRSVSDLVEQQLTGQHTRPACVKAGAAYPTFLQETFPQLRMVDCLPTEEGMVQALRDGVCDVIIVDHPVATQFVLSQSLQGSCTIHNKVGVEALSRQIDRQADMYVKIDLAFYVKGSVHNLASQPERLSRLVPPLVGWSAD